MSAQAETLENVDSSTPGPGAALKARREAEGHDIAAVAQDTRITRTKLVALEADDYAKVGGNIFVVGYIRQYAKWLGMDADPLVREFEQTLSEGTVGVPPVVEADQRPERVGPAQSRQIPLLWIVAGLLIIWVLAAMLLTDANVQKPQTNTTAPVAPTAEMPGTVGEAGGLGVDGKIDGDSGEEPAAVSTGDSSEPLDGPGDTASSGQAAAPGDSDATDEGAGASAQVADTLEISFSDDCWVEVRDVDGDLIFAQLQQAGDNLQLSGQAPFDVLLGKARATTLRVNGRMVNTNPGSNRDTLRLSVGP